MPLGRRTFLSALAGTTALAATACSRTAGAAGPSGVAALGGAQAAARRLLPGHWQQLTFRATPEKAGQDVFRVSGESGRITVEGSTPGVQLTGLRRYLKHEAHANITWAGEQLNLPKLLPAPRRAITGRANARHRFVLNDTNDGYTGAYHDWSYWERELDVLALHGYNEVLVYVGADALYHRVFQEFGYGDDELRQWIPGPAHQPWWLLQNMAGFPAPVSGQLLDARSRSAGGSRTGRGSWA